MELTKERQKEKEARDKIVKALEDFAGGKIPVPEFTKNRLSHKEYHTKLTAEGIIKGVVALGLINNMSGLSAPGVDLYNVRQRYLLDLDYREKVNSIP